MKAWTIVELLRCLILALFSPFVFARPDISPEQNPSQNDVGLPQEITHGANHHEVTLVQLSFDFYMLEAKPKHLIGDRAYDSDGLDDDLKQDGVNMIAPHRSTRKLKTQDGRHLRRYQRRWLVERFFAWLQWKRRLLVRWEYYATNFLGFIQLASITMLLKQF